ncbi:uncharacterized protein LOC122013483 [Zingiber officinale]|uniref:uncharacterized protein LOC122013483 n=1 Tax=Zingiber officinale TaxID=94328 RepID=UPI001C4B17CA|nr:uncharacterized protein LOC122013483 [Zingiber officinale]
MDPYYQHFGGEMESRYYQPNQPQYYHPEPQYYHPRTQYYQSRPQYYPPIEQPNRYEDTQGQFAEPYPAYQSPQGFQGDYSPTWPHPVHQSDLTPWGTFQDEAPPNSTQDLKEIIQQMIEYQKQQFAEIQNFQIQVDQFASSISQQQAPCFSEKRDYTPPELEPEPLLDEEEVTVTIPELPGTFQHDKILFASPDLCQLFNPVLIWCKEDEAVLNSAED